jgi:hypothetical protein
MLNKTQYSVNTVDNIIFSPFPLGDEQLAFAGCSFIFCNWLHFPDVFNVILSYDIKE